MKSKSRPLKLIVFGTLVLLTFAYLLPIYVMVSTSVKSIGEITTGNYPVPTGNPQWRIFTDVLFSSDMMRSNMLPCLVYSSIISFSITILSAFFGGLGGYYLTRNRSLFARILFVLVGIAIYTCPTRRS